MVHLPLSMLRPNLLKISESAFCVELREARHSEAEELQFVPAVVDAGASAPVLRRRRKAPRCESEPDVGMIEVEVEGVTIRAGRGADANTIAAIVQALKASR
jgi:transposase